jgi:macrolide transport system ATP-binding/permease protein
VGRLSTGQQRRLALAVLVARRPDLLLLDEPTNHISLSLATELEEALDRSPGTVLVATHDRWLRRRRHGAELALGGDGRGVSHP